MRILITTGIYPPAIGGPSQYAKNLKEEFEKMGHKVFVQTYNFERHLPLGFRHLYFFIKIIPKLFQSDFCIALDTFSVGLPAVLAGKILGRKAIIRTGGDFLWEQYVERTGDLVLLRDFYQTRISKFSFKDKLIFKLTKWTLQNCSRLVFSTNWQREIWKEPYKLNLSKTFIIENFYGEKIESGNSERKNFIAFTRPLKWKNIPVLKQSFFEAQKQDSEIILDDKSISYEEGMEKIKNCYAVILASLGDISPNMILDAIRFNKPFILTRETGLYEELRDVALFVDPQNPEDIKNAILKLCDRNFYENQKRKIGNFTFTHSWSEITAEFLKLFGL